MPTHLHDRLTNLALIVLATTTIINATSIPVNNPTIPAPKANLHALTNSEHVQGETVDLSETSEYLEYRKYNALQDVTGNYRLPIDLAPSRYELELTPDLSKETFAGKVTIFFTARVDTKRIVLNARNLTINGSKTTIKSPDGLKLETQNQKLDQELEKYTITLKNTMPKDSKQYTVYLEFTGTLKHTDLKGFYLSTYKVGKDTHKLATTQFESLGARRAFPCFDEPQYKAAFQLTINTPTGYTAISNTKPTTTKTKYVFGDTPKMSTYLLAFVVSEFKSTSATDAAEKIDMTVYYNPNLKSFADQSLKYASIAIDKLQEYLGVAYTESTLPKLDIIGIPDFAAGAMENWGLVTFREPQLFFDQSKSTTWDKHRIYTTITHEFAHQWFGDLVTPLYWKYIWLNEGFATFFEYVVTDAIVNQLPEPYNENKWNTIDIFATHARQRAFLADGTNTARPMTSEAETPSDIDALFDYISYQKAVPYTNRKPRKQRVPRDLNTVDPNMKRRMNQVTLKPKKRLRIKTRKLEQSM